MAKCITIALRPEHALQYACLLKALIDAGPQHDAFQGMFLDLKDKLIDAYTDQLTSAEVAKLTQP